MWRVGVVVGRFERERGDQPASTHVVPPLPHTAVLAAWLFWCAQEHALHRHALHSDVAWFGRAIHDQHHARPYHHVSIDGPGLVAAAMVVSAGLAAAASAAGVASPSTCLSLTAGYWASGLLYEATHFLTHTRVRPATRVGAALRAHRAVHHLRCDGAWFAFQAPMLDSLWRTDVPPAGREPRVAAARARAAAAAVDEW